MLEWKSDAHLVVDGVDFEVNPIELGRAAAGGALVLYKARWMVEQYEALLQEGIHEGSNVVELGIYEGGSTALLALLYRPIRLVAVDIRPDRAPALDEFVGRRGLADVVHAYYAVDQADRDRLTTIVSHEFASEPLDLVIDDASHALDETTASFNLLFPRLRPGGLFVIEDWSWQHRVEAGLAEKLRVDERARQAFATALETGELHTPTEQPLSRLALELLLTAAYAPDIVAEMTRARRGWLVVRRGGAALDTDEFDISNCYGALGRGLLA